MGAPVQMAAAATPAPATGGPTHDDAGTPRARSPEVGWEALARSFIHPLRISIVEVLGVDGGRTLSPSEMSYELQAPLARVNHHARALAAAGLIVLVGTRDVRGAVQHFYRLRAADHLPATI